MSNPTWPADALNDSGEGTYQVGGHSPKFAVVRTGDDRRDLFWRAPERDGNGEDIPDTETTYTVDLDQFDLPKLVTALICAHAQRHPDGILHMLDALQAAGEDADYYETVGRLRIQLDHQARRHAIPPDKPVEPPQLRISRYEHSLAIKWHGDDNWYLFEPHNMIHGEEGRRHRVGPNAFTDTPNEEWFDPFADPRPDIRRWTAPLRNQLRAAQQMLDYAEQHPWSG